MKKIYNLTDEEASLIIVLLLNHERTCGKHANAARNNGYGSGRSLEKEKKWRIAADDANELAVRISDNLI